MLQDSPRFKAMLMKNTLSKSKIILNAKKGISSRQLARDIGVNKDTAWSMAMHIRDAMKDS